MKIHCVLFTLLDYNCSHQYESHLFWNFQLRTKSKECLSLVYVIEQAGKLQTMSGVFQLVHLKIGFIAIVVFVG